MITSRRMAWIALSLTVVVLWSAFGLRNCAGQDDAQQSAGEQQPVSPPGPGGGSQDMRAKLNQAAESIVAAANQGIEASSSEEQILERTDLSVEALRILGLLGASGADMQASKLLDDVQAKVSPAAAEVVIRMRLGRQLQRWNQLGKAEREKAINRFVSDVQSAGLTPGQADLLLRLTDNLEMGGHGALAATAVKELLPAFEKSTEPSVQRRAPVMEGILRRLELVGKPLELEGTLLDGSEFDWEAYRGKVVLVDFFANWCGVCREEVPFVLQAHQAYKDKGFEVVGVSLDKRPQLAEQYRQETGFQFPTLFSSDPQAMEWKSPMATRYGVTSLPRAILVDQNGVVVETVARGERLFQHLQELLGPAGAGNGVGQTGEPGSGSEGSVVPAAFDDSTQPGSEAEEPAASAAPSVPEQ